jgi:hypothetical protein
VLVVPATGETEAGGQTWLQSEFKASWSCIVMPGYNRSESIENVTALKNGN